jgi:hypothetical protein
LCAGGNGATVTDAVSVGQDVVVGAVALVALGLIGRSVYRHVYLRKRLFIEPMSNLSLEKQLNTGEALAELLIFEMNRIHNLLRRAQKEDALWSERLALPQMELSAEGYGRLVQDARLLGLPNRLNKLVEFVLRAQPQSLRGSIHKYGPDVRLQLRLCGVQSANAPAVRAWATTFKADEPQFIPDAIDDLAHQVLLDIGEVRGFKSPEAFRAFTTALRHHLDHSTVSRSNALESAIREYRVAIQHDGSNALAACNLGDLLYAQYSFECNELAIEAFTNGLKTDHLTLRARAFRGLANAYCQKYQRYRRHEAAILDQAIHASHAAGRLCGSDASLTPDEVASIKKAQAYAQQVYAEQAGLADDRKRDALARADALYREAIQKHRRFPVAYNNLSYLCLERAKSLHAAASTANSECTPEVLSLLSEANSHCAGAIDSDPTFYLAYDNRGNIARLRARVEGGVAPDLLERAIDDYHEALSYRPTYGAAWGDLAKAHVQLYWLRDERSRGEHAELAWHYHWESLGCVSDDSGRQALCDDFARRRRPERPTTLAERAAACRCLNEGVAS